MSISKIALMPFIYSSWFFLTIQLCFGAGHFTELHYLSQDKITRPYIVYTPDTIDTKQPQPLLVYLHGAISNPNLKPNPLSYMQKSGLVKLADEGGFYLLFSYGQKGATWFDAIGTDMLMGEIQRAHQLFNIDSDKIFLSGFSDGGSGVLYQAVTNPSPFAGMIAMNGSLNVATKLGVQPLYPENSNNLPLYIINTKEDMLYPITQIQPTIDFLKQFNTHIHFASVPGNHDISYLKQQSHNILQFIKHNHRVPTTFLSLETSTPPAQLRWIRIDQLNDSLPRQTWHKPYQLEILNDKAAYGIQFDYQYSGPGLKVAKISSSSTGERIGIKLGDIILKMEQTPMESPYSPYIYLASKKAGDKTEVTILRDGQEKILQGTFNTATKYSVFNPDKHSGKLTAQINGNQLIIKTSRIASFSINFHELAPYNIEHVIINDKPHTTPSNLDWVTFYPSITQ